MNVTIMDSCTGCGACEAINSEVFSVDTIAHVNEDAVAENEQDCIDAALICPVNAIWIDDL
jgi:ferredoxin